jgi:hypothetical protein
MMEFITATELKTLKAVKSFIVEVEVRGLGEK